MNFIFLLIISASLETKMKNSLRFLVYGSFRLFVAKSVQIV